MQSREGITILFLLFTFESERPNLTVAVYLKGEYWGGIRAAASSLYNIYGFPSLRWGQVLYFCVLNFEYKWWSIFGTEI